MVSRKLSIRDEPNIRLRRSRNVKKSLVLPMKNVPVCTFKTSPFALVPRAHVFQHVCAWCRYKRGRFERTHGDVLSGHTEFRSVHTHTLTNTTQHITTQHITTTTPHGERQREKRRRKRRDKTREEKTKEDRREK